MPEPNQQLNGKVFYVPGQPEIYWIDNGLARHIPDEATYHGVFGGSPNKQAYSQLLTQVAAGPPIADGTELVRAGNDAKIYFVENKTKRWIPSEAIKAKFQLNGNVQSLPLATVNSFANGPAFVDPASMPGPTTPVPTTPVPTTSVSTTPVSTTPVAVDPGPRPRPVDPLPTPVPGSGTKTLNTQLGPINWVELPDGTIHAEANGLKLVITGTSNPNVSGESHLEYSLISGQPYLSMNFIWNEPERQVAFSIYGGPSHLTLTLSNIDEATNSGAYLLSGIWDGTAVSQTSKADLTLDPLSCGPVNGWPVGAFKTELDKLAVFNPLGITLGKNVVAKHGEPRGEGGAPVIREHSKGASLGKAALVCVLGGLAGALAGPWGMAAGCLGAADISMTSDEIDNLDERSTNPQPVNPPVNPQPVDPPVNQQPVDPPVNPDPTPSGPVCVSGDGLDNPGGGSGGGGKPPIESGDPPIKEN